MMILRPEGIVTRSLVARLSPRSWLAGRRRRSLLGERHAG
jgi:hypothetical protein